MKKRSRFGWLLALLRYGLCVAAGVYLWYNVPWYDRVHLRDGSRPRLISQDQGGFLVRWGTGREEVIAPQMVHYLGDTPDLELGIATVAQRIDPRLCALALLLFLPVPFMAAQRLVWMLAIQDVRLTRWESIKLTFAGNFFNFALPGTTGGDLIKAYYITQYTHQKTEAVTTVFLDRVIGLLGLMALATVMFVLSWRRVTWDPAVFTSIGWGLTLVWSALVFGCLIVFSRRLRELFKLSAFAARLPAGQHLLRIGRATVAMRRQKALVLASLAITVVLQALVVVSAWVMSLALDMQGGFVLYFICVPIGFLIAAIPISPPQAIGVMEAAYIQFFTPGGLNSASQAFAFALAVRVIQLAWALPGVLVPLLGAHAPRRADLEALEDESAAEPGVAAPLGGPARAASGG
ncbi:MAG: flippase-like domain-containing protein [Phycisphaerae bacterium]|nr:flippase-like domain-containing protein [Phycisphaerae bacterium]MCZ2401204.1 flippase-like domain-containing protein [Phycisphaerae bacterium]NUQ48766.1 flippase-like domain-containing protein [Phycisphaerae bacterium]